MMFNPVKTVNRWLTLVQSSLKIPWVKVPQTLIPAQEQTLPAALTRDLNSAIQELLPPFVQVDQIVEALRKAIQRWQENDNMPNVLVVLTEPIQPTDGLLAAVVEQVQVDFKNFQVNRLDNWSKRPADYIGVEAKVNEAIIAMVKKPKSDDDIKLAVIPTLGHYFLRCVDGLEAIETIRHAIVEHPDCFWLIGCNRWAWHYLDKVCYLSAYLEQSFELPALGALELRHWLAPLNQVARLKPFAPPADPESEKPSLQPDNAAQERPSLDALSPWRSQDEKDYFKSIEKEAKGIASVAAAAWLYSLEYELVDPAANQSHQHTIQQDVLGDVKRGQIALPDAPSLTTDERFLLYAILLHGSLSSQHLALTLAEPEGKVQAELQALKRQDLIEKKMQGWTVNPAYFLSLRRDLNRNNFLLG